jgi:hypothetical protein
MTTELKYHIIEADQHKNKLKEKPKEANTGSFKLPLPIATQLYCKRKVKNNRTKPRPQEALNQLVAEEF